MVSAIHLIAMTSLESLWATSIRVALATVISTSSTVDKSSYLSLRWKAPSSTKDSRTQTSSLIMLRTMSYLRNSSLWVSRYTRGDSWRLTTHLICTETHWSQTMEPNLCKRTVCQPSRLKYNLLNTCKTNRQLMVITTRLMELKVTRKELVAQSSTEAIRTAKEWATSISSLCSQRVATSCTKRTTQRRRQWIVLAIQLILTYRRTPERIVSKRPQIEMVIFASILTVVATTLWTTPSECKI